MMDAVTTLLREAAQTAIMPRFRALTAEQIEEKSPGEVVTVADREAEDLISRGLRGLLDVPVVGEEAAAADPGLLTALREAPAAWVVDPLDGTANFIAGRPDFAVMAALVRAGQTTAAWILQPVPDVAYTAELGSGTFREGIRVRRTPPPADMGRLRGAAHTRFLDPPARARVQAAAASFAELGAGSSCAGVDYPRMVEGDLDFILFWRTLPWDHAPGSLLLSEAGGAAWRPDGEPYRPADDRPGLLLAADAPTWHAVRSPLLG